MGDLEACLGMQQLEGQVVHSAVGVGREQNGTACGHEGLHGRHDRAGLAAARHSQHQRVVAGCENPAHTICDSRLQDWLPTHVLTLSDGC